MVTLLLHPVQLSLSEEGFQSYPAVFAVEFLSTSTSLTSAVVASSILSNSEQYSFNELIEPPEPLELVEITPNGSSYCFIIYPKDKFLLFNICSYMQL